MKNLTEFQTHFITFKASEKHCKSSAFFILHPNSPLTNLSLRDTIELQKYFRKGEKL
jgi:hypothetical protein